MQIFVIDWQDVLVDSSDLPTYLAATYQPLLVSGTSIKTINGQSLLGAGNIAISVDLSGYLPIAGGTMAGNLDMDHYQISNVQAIDSDEITLNGLPVASEQYASNASNLASGTVPFARLPVGTTSVTVCAGNDSRLSDARTPTSHVHGNVTSVGAIGSTSGLPVLTGASGVLTTGTTTGSGTVVVLATSPTLTTPQIGSSNPVILVNSAIGLSVTTNGSTTTGIIVSEIRTSTYRDANGTRHLVFGGNFVQVDHQLFINAKPTVFGGITKAALLAKTAHVTNEGVYRITDSTPAQRLAYPDGTNWRYLSDDTVVT